MPRCLAERSPNPGSRADRLGIASTVRFKLFTLDNQIIRRRAGRLSTADAKACQARLQSMLGFTD